VFFNIPARQSILMKAIVIGHNDLILEKIVVEIAADRICDFRECRLSPAVEAIP